MGRGKEVESVAQPIGNLVNFLAVGPFQMWSAHDSVNRPARDILSVFDSGVQARMTTATDQYRPTLGFDSKRLVVSGRVSHECAISLVFPARRSIGILARDLPKCMDTGCDLEGVLVGDQFGVGLDAFWW